MARLIVRHHDEVRREVELKPDMLIGRDVDADVLIGPPASRQHAKIEHDGSDFFLQDLNSKAGTYVDGRKITRIRLVSGMEIAIGEYILVFDDPGAVQEAPVGWVVEPGPEPPLDVVATLDATGPMFARHIESVQTAGEARRLRQILQTIHDIGVAIATKQDIESVLIEVVERLSDVLPAAQRGFLALCDRHGRELAMRVLKTRKDESAAEMFSGTIARQAVESRCAILCKDAREEFSSADSVQEMELGSVMCVPLLLPDRAVGILQWDARGVTGAFSRDDLNLLTGIASLLAAALENARLCDELRAAKEQSDIENVRLRRAPREEASLAAIIGESEPIQEVRRLAQQVMDVDTGVLITGETGTGKELLAHAIHRGGPHSGEPFIAVNCAAIPETLLESELFGIEKGTATGVEQRIGKLEQANGGTLFLDEVGDMPLAMQAKLLRALEQKTVQRVGGKKPIRIDARIIAATNRDLKTAIRNKEFREDLYYRLKVVEVHLPPLRERSDDILILAGHFLTGFAADMGKSLPGFTPAAEAKLRAHVWPGNVRELRNAVERAVVLSPHGKAVDVDALPPEIIGEDGDLIETCKRRGRLDAAVAALEREMIEAALKETGGVRTKAARLLGISREGLRLKLLRHGISS
ncbi:MAG: FHA domain-containing protein [Planctomycetes bacterium]|nr:FHA domain-containing protein [Planctomycetota bacterium]